MRLGLVPARLTLCTAGTFFCSSPGAPSWRRSADIMASPAAHRVSYYYDTDVGNFYYAQGHPMKPYRVRMTHNLLLSYGMLDRMDILVRLVVHKMYWLSLSISCHHWFSVCRQRCSFHLSVV